MDTVRVRARRTILGLAAGEEVEVERTADVERMLRLDYWVELKPCQAME